MTAAYARYRFWSIKPCISPAAARRSGTIARIRRSEVDGFLERQFFPLAEQGFLRTQRFRTAFEQGFNRALDRGIEAALRGDHVDQSQASAVAASMFSPSSPASGHGPSRSGAGNNAAWMTEGIPTLTSGMPNLASCAAIRKSQAAATSSPRRGTARHPRDHRRGKRAHGLAEIAQACDEFLGGGLIELCHFLDIGAS